MTVFGQNSNLSYSF